MADALLMATVTDTRFGDCHNGYLCGNLVDACKLAYFVLGRRVGIESY